MKLQKNTRLALYGLLEFAAEPARHVSAAEIAARYRVSPHHLAKVLCELKRAGLVESVRGVGGGYRFTANARRLTLMDAILVFEELGAAPADRGDPADATPVGQALATVLSEIDEMARATLSSITLATMLRLVERQQQALAAPPRTAPRRARGSRGLQGRR